MNPQVQMRVSDMRIWALKQESANKFYALVTPQQEYEKFNPNDIIVHAYEFDNSKFLDMFYQVMHNVMQYQIHVDNYFKKKWYQLIGYHNYKVREMAKPYIEKFYLSEYVTPDSTLVNGNALMTCNIALKEDEYKPIPGFKRLTYALAQKQDNKRKYLYALALPIDMETQKFVDLAAVYITAFMANDPEFERYKKAIYDCKLDFDRKRNLSCIYDYCNEERMTRFNDYFTKVK